ncbi:MAG: ATP-binding protein [Spirochaetaceae bacterium]|nr:MAG: ATP-binding protein [Spirochaetaceae bacterium]
MIPRLISPLPGHSFFLFGARGTGKSTFLDEFFKDSTTIWIDLLDPEQEDRYARNPSELRQQIAANRESLEWVVIDEVQKVPKLLDVVHAVVEKENIRFALTGSSARRLKKDTVNLLAGRAFVYNLFPFTHQELGSNFDLDQALQFGTLPTLFSLNNEKEYQTYLRAYSLTYLKEEVWAEHLIRKLDPFRRFLEIAAQSNGEIINYSNIAADVGADHKTVASYFEILEDTLLGFVLEPFHHSLRKRQLKSPKFFFFDPGVVRALTRMLTVALKSKTYAYGRAFEHFVIVEIIRLSSYHQKDFRFSYLNTKDGVEIDLIVERPGQRTALIEIKSTTQVSERDIRQLARFKKDLPFSEAFCLSQDPVKKQINGVLALPWEEGIKALGL